MHQSLGLTSNLSLENLQAWGVATTVTCPGRNSWSDHSVRLLSIEPLFFHPCYLETFLPVLQSNYIALERKHKTILIPGVRVVERGNLGIPGSIWGRKSPK